MGTQPEQVSHHAHRVWELMPLINREKEKKKKKKKKKSKSKNRQQAEKEKEA
jgi:hypothetical protein